MAKGNFDNKNENSNKLDSSEKTFEEILVEQAKRLAAVEKEAKLAALKSVMTAQLKSAKEIEDKKKAYEKKLEDEKLAKTKRDNIKYQLEIYAQELKNIKSLNKERQKLDLERAKRNKEENEQIIETYEKLLERGENVTEELKDAFKQAKSEMKTLRKANVVEGIDNAIQSLVKLTSGVDNAIAKYTSYAVGINARLQGATFTNSRNYFSVLEQSLQKSVGVTGFFKTETMMDNLQKLVEEGVATNLDQRAFLNTLKDDIATTFDAANGTLLRLIRLQQSDSTASRLGMEAYLTRFLNELVSDTSYLKQTFDSVETALIDASSQMTSSMATEMEYVVQKWLGALTGVGLSESTATNIATALGQLGSGNVEALSGSNMQNLLITAASRANLSYSDLLQGGLTAKNTNALMRSLVDYMVEMGSSGSNVVKSQLASTFGIGISDLTAASQLASSLDTITRDMMSVDDMYKELGYQMGVMSERVPIQSRLATYFENLQFGLGANIASNPAAAALWKVNTMIEQATGGINIPAAFAFGTGVDLKSTVNQLMKLGLVGYSTLGMIGDLITGVGNMTSPVGMLSALKIMEGNQTITRGTGVSTRQRGTSLSESSFIGSSSSSDLYQQTLQAANESVSQQTVTTGSEADNVIPNILKYLTETLDARMASLEGNMNAMSEKMVSIESKITDEINVNINQTQAEDFRQALRSGGVI